MHGTTACIAYKSNEALWEYSEADIGLRRDMFSTLAIFAEIPLMTDVFPAQMTSNAECISISWRHHYLLTFPSRTAIYRNTAEATTPPRENYVMTTIMISTHPWL